MKKSSDPKGWIRGNTKIGPYLQGKYGVEIRIESVNKDNSHLWVRISHGLNKLVTDLSNNKEDDNNEQETSETKTEIFALKTNVLAFASRSNAKAKPWRRTSACSSTRTTPEDYSPVAYPVSKRLSTLLRHGHLPRKDDGAIEFWRLKDCLRYELWEFSTLVWWKVEVYNGKRRRKQENISILYWSIRTRNYLSPRSSRSFRTLFHWSFITGQCVNSERFLRVHLPHLMCNQLALHHEFRDWYREDKIWATDRQCSFCLWIQWTKNTRILTRSTWMHRVLHGTSRKTWKKLKNTVYWVDIKLGHKKGFRFYQTRSNAIILYDTLLAYCIPMAIMMGNWRNRIRESICVTSTSSEDFLEK